LSIEESIMGAPEFVSPLQLSRIATDFKVNQHNTLWITMTQSPLGRTQNFSRDLLQDVCTLHKSIHAYGIAWVSNGAKHPIDYAVLRSEHPDYFSLGGDLAYFMECIRERNANALRAYAMLCADMVYDWSATLNRQATTIALVQGRALGGGFETALASDFLIAEEHSEFGFPEILFGLFPCSGGMSLLARRIGVHEAERMMTNGRVYSAAELKAKGVIDELCPKGQGVAAVEKFIAAHARHHAARLMLQRSRYRVAPLSYDELRTVVDEWVEIAMELSEADLRVMDMLIKLQRASILH
jgi:DSF synthase